MTHLLIPSMNSILGTSPCSLARVNCHHQNEWKCRHRVLVLQLRGLTGRQSLRNASPDSFQRLEPVLGGASLKIMFCYVASHRTKQKELVHVIQVIPERTLNEFELIEDLKLSKWFESTF
jgi:hypothetical protein